MVNPASMTLADAAGLLTRNFGRRVTEDMLQETVDAGCPLNPDGSFNLIIFCAWLTREDSHENRYASPQAR